MGEIYNRQKSQEDLQRSDEFAGIFSKIVSGKAGYKTVIEKKKIPLNCRKCNLLLDSDSPPKFCPECGTKVWIKPEKCQKCGKGLFPEDKFCTECGENMEAPPL